MKKVLVAAVLVAIVLALSACGGEASGFKVPDVFGINYVDATEILEAEGFEVKAIETSVETISEKLLYPLEKVDKGAVFKVDNYILDNLGNLTKDYDIDYDVEFLSEDRSLIIYYAKEAYVLEKDVPEEETTTTTEEKETTTTTKKTTTTKGTTTTTARKESLRSDFKEAMDSYEKFMNEYVAFMKKYKNNPTDLSLLTDYADYMSKYAEFVSDFEEWDSDDMNAAELAYYLDVQARVAKKLAEVAS